MFDLFSGNSLPDPIFYFFFKKCLLRLKGHMTVWDRWLVKITYINSM